MTEELEQIPVSEEVVQEEAAVEAQEAPRTVPLEALEAERRKRQDLEAQNKALQELMMKSNQSQAAQEEAEDDDEFITKAEMKQRLEKVAFTQKREVLEEAFLDARPEAVELINKHWNSIIEKKPWLAKALESAPNRYARAYEIVQDYMPKEEKLAPASKFSRPQADAKKIIENSQKPGNPATISKAAQSSAVDHLKSIQGKPEFREYRKKMLARG